MSPEIAQEARDIDARSDLWTIGVILFECLTGQKPFQGRELLQLLTNIAQSPLPSVHALVAGAPQLDEVLRGAMCRDLSRRFQTAREFGAALLLASARSRDQWSEFFTGHAVASVPETPSLLPPRRLAFDRSEEAPATSNAGTFEAVVTASDRAAPRRSRSLFAGAALVAALAVVGGALLLRGSGSTVPPRAAASVVTATPLPPQTPPVTPVEPGASLEVPPSSPASPPLLTTPDVGSAPSSDTEPVAERERRSSRRSRRARRSQRPDATRSTTVQGLVYR
ncbi:MAG: serine/threonine-protein kinase [Polyangiales bacterium]